MMAKCIHNWVHRMKCMCIEHTFKHFYESNMNGGMLRRDETRLLLVRHAYELCISLSCSFLLHTY